ncbi:MAG: DNA repair protein RecO, partial [Patescibacteria group bacterium]
MFIHYRSRGLIFKKEERGEADLLFTVYTKDFGKLEILGKSVRKIASKLRPSAEVFYLSEIEFIQGKIQKTLTDATLVDKFSGIRGDLKKIRIAHKISEVLDNLIKGQEPDEKIW